MFQEILVHEFVNVKLTENRLLPKFTIKSIKESKSLKMSIFLFQAYTISNIVQDKTTIRRFFSI